MASFFEDSGYSDLISRLQQEPETGQFSRYKTIDGAEESKARELAMLKEFNQREQDMLMREKLARALNSQSGRNLGTLIQGVQGLNVRDMEKERISSNEELQRSLQAMTERQNVRQDERVGKQQELESILTDKKLSSDQKIAALNAATQRRGQDITQSEGRETRGLQKSMFEGEQSGLTQRQQAELAAKKDMLGITEQGQNERLDKSIGSQEKMSKEQMTNQKFMQALIAGVARGDEEAVRTLQELVKSGQKSPISRLLSSINPFTP